MHETSINSQLHVNVYFRQLIYIRQLNQVTDMHLVSGGLGKVTVFHCRPSTWRVKALHFASAGQPLGG